MIIGKSVKCASGGTVTVYPYEQSPTGPKRTHVDTIDHAEKAIAENKSVSLVTEFYKHVDTLSYMCN